MHRTAAVAGIYFSQGTDDTPDLVPETESLQDRATSLFLISFLRFYRFTVKFIYFHSILPLVGANDSEVKRAREGKDCGTLWVSC